jgi:hypothetical protein
MNTELKVLDENGKPRNLIVLKVLNAGQFEEDANELYSKGYKLVNASSATQTPGIIEYVGFFEYIQFPMEINFPPPIPGA